MTAAALPTHFDVRSDDDSLGRLFGVFVRYRSPRILLTCLAVAAAIRIALGGWTWWDLLVPAVLVALQPFTEWLIHTFILHFRPRTIAGRRVDLHLASEHRKHHADPRHIGLVFIPWRALAIGIPITVGLIVLAAPTVELAATIVLAIFAMLNVYEWVHFLTHSPRRPRSRYYRYIQRAHRLHHFKNERYWMGVTVHLADHILGTFPAKSDVETSATAKNLLG
jgi:hypothetical protein